MVDNFALIRDFMKFEDPDHFYFLQIIQRKKDGPGPNGTVSGTNNKSRSIKTYCITSKEMLDRIEIEVKHLCEYFNARACIYLARRSFKKVALKNMVDLANDIADGNYFHAKTAYWSACGKTSVEKLWLIDIDEEDLPYMDLIENCIQNIARNDSVPFGERILLKVPTKHGYHFICRPFNILDLQAVYPNKNSKEFIHKDNPTVLYIA